MLQIDQTLLLETLDEHLDIMTDKAQTTLDEITLARAAIAEALAELRRS